MFFQLGMYVPAPLLNPAHNPGTCNCIVFLKAGGGDLKMSKCNKNWVYIVKISLKLCIIQAKCCPQNYDFVRIWYLDVKVKIYYFIISNNSITVQEQHITYNAHTLSNWLTGYGSSGHVDDSFAFLPRQLDANMLLYPSVTNMFEDLAIHRLCFFVGEYEGHNWQCILL